MKKIVDPKISGPENEYLIYTICICFTYVLQGFCILSTYILYMFSHVFRVVLEKMGVENDFFPKSFGDVWGMFWHHRWCLRRARKNQKRTFWSREKVRTKMMQNHLLIIFH